MLGGRTGGHGKTVMAMAIHALLELRGLSANVAAVDTAGSSTRSKIGGVLDDVREIGVSAELGKILSNSGAALTHWDALSDQLMSEAGVVDLGANVISSVLAWGVEAELGAVLGESSVSLIVPVRDSEISVRDAVAVVNDARAAEREGGLKFKRIVLALTHIAEMEDVLANSSRGRLEALDAPMIRVGRERGLLRHLELSQRRFGWAYRVPAEELLGLFPEYEYKITAWRLVRDFCAWLDGIDAELVRVGLFAEPMTTRRDFWKPFP
jgi:hypothetical protein